MKCELLPPRKATVMEICLTRRLTIIALLCLSPELALLMAQETQGQSPSFIVQSYRSGPSAEVVLRQCQLLREELQTKWLSKTSCAPWQPCCEIVLHGARASYIHSVGRGAAQTLGSTLIRTDGQKIIKRRIDLLVNQDREFPALSHELVHVILADRFGADKTPLWADEGIATVMDSAAKRSLHRQDCVAALHCGTALRIIDLLQLEQFKSPNQVPAFYGQSLSLVSFLVEQRDRATFVEFLELAQKRGYDYALRETYGIDGVARLEMRWREFAVSGSTAADAYL